MENILEKALAALEESKKEVYRLREALEGIVNMCPNDCSPISNCWKCQIALEALGLVDEHGQPIDEA